jgi:hypothetical protein
MLQNTKQIQRKGREDAKLKRDELGTQHMRLLTIWVCKIRRLKTIHKEEKYDANTKLKFA